MAGEADTRLQESTMEVPEGMHPACKSRLMRWRVVGAVLAFLVVLGWVFIIVVLILKEKWQLVLVAWLLLYSAAHFCYWYCKRHSLLTLHRQIRLRVLAHIRPAEAGEKLDDCPPTYDEVMKTEAPPPAYFTVVTETVKLATLTSAMSSVTPPVYVTSVSSQLQQAVGAAAREYLQCPPAYQSPRHFRRITPRILPTVHEARLPTDTAVTATAAATAAVTAAAALAAVSHIGGVADSETLEDPIRGPIVRHLRSTTIATMEVSSSEEVSSGPSTSSPSVTRNVKDQICEIDHQTPSSVQNCP
ncbi:uncharacterized protein [Procambarus clarkii]|uniref:uncharacterized protein n=1 Tax=Procambarus clarkii TaxID=6728 RepID=UPI001E6753BD|nr:uncharacterized protein LOC123748570 [Procambarus clarkii]XP_045610189.1 uncharacterized protein LOC123765555 [Procambarus clarkii]XP_045610190.1 uncharacterized protein LOC123765555 [Procambarus clarkii]